MNIPNRAAYHQSIFAGKVNAEASVANMPAGTVSAAAPAAAAPIFRTCRRLKTIMGLLLHRLTDDHRPGRREAMVFRSIDQSIYRTGSPLLNLDTACAPRRRVPVPAKT